MPWAPVARAMSGRELISSFAGLLFARMVLRISRIQGAAGDGVTEHDSSKCDVSRGCCHGDLLC